MWKILSWNVPQESGKVLLSPCLFSIVRFEVHVIFMEYVKIQTSNFAT